MNNMRKTMALIACAAVAGCGGGNGDGEGGGSGRIAIDGSSTVFPLAQAAAEQFQGETPGVQVSVGQSGTGGGFEKFCNGEIEISNASRPIKDDEVAACERNGVDYAELQAANDGIAVTANKSLAIDCLTTDQLSRLWSKGSEVRRYSQIDPSFPDVEVSLFGPGTDSGTFDFFTAEINGEEGNTRKDYQPSEDDNVLVQGVSGDEGGLGYFGFSYYEQNQERLNLVAVDGGGGCVKPSLETIQDGTYKPLSRPVFMYVSREALARAEVRTFMDYVLENQQRIAEAAQMVPMTGDQVAAAKAALGG